MRARRLGGFLLVVALAAVLLQLVVRRWELTGLLVVALLVVGAGALTVRQNRSVHRVLGVQRRRLRTVARIVERLEAAQSTASRDDSALIAARRQLQEDHRSLSEQSAVLMAGLSDLKAMLQEQSSQTEAGLNRFESRLRALRVDVSKAVTTVPEPARAAAAASQSTGIMVVGEDMLVGLQVDAQSPSVNLVLDSFTATQIFAGVRTAVLVAVQIADRLDRRLRVVVLREPDGGPVAAEAALAGWIRRETDKEKVARDVVLESPSQRSSSGYHADDVWIATYWATAVAVGRACDEGTTDPHRVIYLVQDWEPGFFAWGALHALADSTYRMGFRLLVNSTPLANYIRTQSGAEVPSDCVFAPQVDLAGLRRSAAGWSPGDPAKPRVLFYARPSKPRNLYPMGVAALQRWTSTLPADVRPQITFAGEDVPPVDLGDRADVLLAGKLDFDSYYDLLSRTDIGLALMHSPHPSHLPLELPLAGIPTVTNALAGYRRRWLPALQVAPMDAGSLAEALDAALLDAAHLRVHSTGALPDDLGGSLASAADAVLRELNVGAA